MTLLDPKGHKQAKNINFKVWSFFDQKLLTHTLEKSRFLEEIQIFF